MMSITPEMARRELARRELMRRGYNMDAISSSDSAMKESSPNIDEEEGILTKTGRGLLKGTRDVISGGIGGLADLVTLPVTAPLRAFGVYDTPSYEETLSKGIDKLTDGFTEDKTDADKIWAASRRGIASLPTSGLAGKAIGAYKGAKTIGDFLKLGTNPTLSNMASQAGASAATQSVLNEHENNPEESSLSALGDLAAAGFFGGMAGDVSVKSLSKIGKGLKKTGSILNDTAIDLKNPHRIKRAISSWAGVNPETAEAIDRAGLKDVKTLGMISDKVAPKLLESQTAKHPIRGEKLQEIYKKFPDMLKKSVLGEGAEIFTDKEAGEALGKAVKNAKKQIDTKFKEQKASYEKGLTKKTLIPVTETYDIAQDIIKEALNLSPSVRKSYMKTPEYKMSKELLRSYAENNGSLRYADLNYFQDKFNNLANYEYGKGNIFNKFNASIKNDLDLFLDSSSQNMGARSKFKKDYSKYKKEIEPNLNSIKDLAEKGDPSAFLDLYKNVKKGGNKLSIVTKGMEKEEVHKLTETLLNKFGKNKEGKWEGDLFTKNFKELPEEIQDFIFSNTSSPKRQIIKDAITTQEAVSSVKSVANSSFSDVHKMTRKWYANLYDAAKEATLGRNLKPLANEIFNGLLTKGLSDKILTDPQYLDNLVDAAKLQRIINAKKKVAPSAINSLLHKLENSKILPKETREIFNTLKSDMKQFKKESRISTTHKAIIAGASRIHNKNEE